MNDFLFSIAGFILAIGLLVAVHEFGHFWVARRLGVKVLKFSIGFGRPLWSRVGRDGIEYAIAALPFGGYVKMLDETEDENIPEHEAHRAFNRQALWKRTAVVVAGPLFNFLFAFVAYWFVFMAGIDGVKPIVGAVVDGSLAERGGFKVGDEILKIDGKATRSWNEHRLYLFNRALARNSVPVQVRTQEGEIALRRLHLDAVPLRELDAGLLENGIGLYGYIPEIPPVIGSIQEDSPAGRSALRVGDRIVAMGDKRIENWRGLVDAVRPLAGRSTIVTLERSNQRLEVRLRPEPVEVRDTTIGRIGISPKPVSIPEEYRVHVTYGPVDAVAKSAGSVWVMSVLTLKMLAKIVTLEVSAKNISGPLTIAQFAGDSVQVGWDRFFLFLAIVSISLGVLNLLPIPVLDGGHLLYYAMEAVTGGPPSKQVLLWGQQIGLAMLFALMSLAFYNDIVRLLQ
ncbi:MAG: Regulator of sigma-E protease RseP [Gammaproteobacteria bacterium]|nr:Regulator of sigma-E protease RseP [Gammaproteobacteria bacterium]